MGQYRFTIPSCKEFQNESLLAAQIVGLEGVPWPCKTTVEDNQLIISRNTDVSGRLLIPFTSALFGEICLTTGTLPEKPSLYLLDVELARGTLSRLRNQVSIWREGGLAISEEFDARLHRLTDRFSESVFLLEGEHIQKRVELCIEILGSAIELAFEITDEFSDQVSKIRLEQEQTAPIIVGSIVRPELIEPLDGFAAKNLCHPVQATIHSDFESASNEPLTHDLAVLDSTIEWIAAQNTSRILGPILDFSLSQPPGWLGQPTTFDSQLKAAVSLCRQLGQRYSGKLKIVHVASGLNGVGHQHFNYPQQLQLTLEMIEALDQSLINTSLMVSFDQPWGERLAMATGGVQAMEIADSLLRYGARLSALGLEFNLNYWPHGTLMRDPLQWVDLIDRWAQFGLPLATLFSAPTGEASALDSTTRFFQTIRSGANRNQFSNVLSTLFKMIVNRPSVNIISWNYLSDQTNERFPQSGLVNSQMELKPIAQWFQEIQDYADAVTNPKRDEV